MNWIDYKKLLDEEFKIAIELDNYDDKWMRDYRDKWMCDYRDKRMHDYNDKWMRVNNDDPNSQVCSGRLATAPQRPKPSFTVSCKKRYTPLRKRFLTTKRHASLKVST